MGINFSKSRNQNDKNAEFRCYYELLDISQHATAEEIRKAYKIKAFQLHPDKNQNRVQEATSEFSLVQNAYQILSDPQERAWYDNHRTRLLKRSDSKYEVQLSIDILLKFFCNSCYSGYDDSPTGFYAVYRELFANIEAFENSDNGSRDFKYTTSSFGLSNTSYMPTLAEFYDKWTNFVSFNSFEHIQNFDEYSSEGRRYRRAASKENQKLREKHRREFSETVRALAAFVQKRDPRYTLWKKQKLLQREIAEKENKKKIQEVRRKQTEGYKDAEWSSYGLDDLQLESILEKTGSLSIDDAEPLECEELYCIPCKKVFKNKNQWHNHERSKRHRDNLELLGIETISSNLDDSISSANCFEASEQDEILFLESEFQGDPIAEDCFEAAQSQTPLENKITEEKHSERIQPQAKLKNKKSKSKKTKAKKVVEDPLSCNTCGQSFDSRNQLFQHIKLEDHALKLS